jgi:hypothetical protein
MPHSRVRLLASLMVVILSACSTVRRSSIEGVWVAAGSMSESSETIEFKRDGTYSGWSGSPTLTNNGQWERRGNAYILRQLDLRSKKLVELPCSVTNDEGVLVLKIVRDPKDKHPLILNGIRKEDVSTETNLFGFWVGKGSDPMALSLTDTYSAHVSFGMMDWPAIWRRHGKEIIVEIRVKGEDMEGALMLKVAPGDLPDTLDVFSVHDGQKLETLTRAGKRKPQRSTTSGSP